MTMTGTTVDGRDFTTTGLVCACRRHFPTKSMKQLLLDIVPPPAPSFENMVAGENAAVIAAARALAPGQTLYVWGQDGCGRSHLLQAFASQHAGAARGMYLSASLDATAIDDLVQNLPDERLAVAVDDIHTASETALAAVFRLYNHWRERGGSGQAISLMVSGNRPPLQMDCREDLRTRLGWGPVYRLMPLSDEEKMDALAQFAHQQGIPLGSEIVRWLLTHGSRDIRVLFDWVTELDRYSLAMHRPITLPLLKTMLAQKGLDHP